MDKKNSGASLATAQKRKEPVRLDRWRWAMICAGGVLLALSFPPIGLGFVSFVALVPWTLLICHPVPLTRWQYRGLWLVGFLFWLWLLESIRKAHPILYVGLAALSGYLALYIPVFVAVARMLVHKAKWPAWLVVPVVWTALELVRAYLITGFSMANLGHAVARYPALIQLASLGGAYAVGFVIALVGATIGCALFELLRSYDRSISASPFPLALVGQSRLVLASVLALALATLFASGWSLPKLRQAEPSKQKPFRVAVVQGSLDVVFETSSARQNEVLSHYRETIRDEAKRFSDRDGHPPTLYLLPESSLPFPYFEADSLLTPPSSHTGTVGEFKEIIQDRQAEYSVILSDYISGLRLPRGEHYVVLGGAKIRYTDAPVPTITNDAILFDSEGKMLSSYAKCHPVMFGEYLPFGAWFPWIYQVTPLPAGITPGPGAKPFEIDGLVFSPSICFESTVPHVIARHVGECRAKEKEVDALVNITNDGWFWGGAILDLQAQCNIMRAVEHGKPMFVAANTGLSMVIDSDGRVIAKAPRRKPKVLVETVPLGGRAPTIYSRIGDVFALGCLIASGAVLGRIMIAGRAKRKK
jgi:apolipoprotein N-acyltransferase